MLKRYINIQYPFQNSDDGLFLKMNTVDKDAIKSDLMHLILTKKGERLYNPDFGTNLLRLIFQPNDGYTEDQIKDEIMTAVNKYLPKLKVNNITIDNTEDTDNEGHLAIVKINYSVTDDVFTTSDFVIIKI